MEVHLHIDVNVSKHSDPLFNLFQAVAIMKWMLVLGTLTWISKGLEDITSSQAPTTDPGFTLRQPARSYLQYHPQWNLHSKFGFGLTFRTLKANTFLLHNIFDSDIEREAGVSELWMKLQRGQLQALHILDGHDQDLTAGRGKVLHFLSFSNTGIKCR